MPSLFVERDTEILIDNQLKNLGWTNDPHAPNRNVYQQRVKTDEQKKKLKGLKPDYVLYHANDPIAIIEAKKQGKNIHDALRQGIEYAEKLNTPIVFATDGVFTKTLHVKSNKPLLLNGEEIDELIRETLALKYLTTNEVNTLDKKVVKSRGELISIFSTVNNLLREEGLQQGLERFTEFANILFLKVLSEIEDGKEEHGERSNIDNAYRWDFFREKKGKELLSYISDTVLHWFSMEYKDDNIFQRLQITHPDNLKAIVDLLDGLQLTDINADIKGDAFEYFIRSYSASNPSDLGEIFTPRHIVKTMVRLLKPEIGEKIYDPFCGTGGMLTVAFKYLMDTMPRNVKNIHTLKQETVYGADITKTASIAKMNMILAGDGHNNIKRIDSLANPIDDEFEIVLTNMPFAQSTRYGEKYQIPNRNGDIVCPQHCFRALKKGGRMALIVPEGFLANTNHKAYHDIRKYLLENANLQSVISLPRGAFEPYNGIKADILYFTDCKKAKTNSHYWFFDVKNDGYTLDKKRQKIEGDNDLELVLSENNLDDQAESYLLSVGISKISLKKVKENDYVLSGLKYIERKTYDAEFVSFESLEKQGVLIAKKGQSITQAKTEKGDIPVIAGGQTSPYTHSKPNYEGNIITISASGAYSGYVWYHDYPIWASDCTVLYSGKENILLTKYLYHILKSKQEEIHKLQHGAGQPHVYWMDLRDVHIPLPDIEKQRELVNDLEVIEKRISEATKEIGKNREEAMKRIQAMYSKPDKQDENPNHHEDFDKVLRLAVPPAKPRRTLE